MKKEPHALNAHETMVFAVRLQRGDFPAEFRDGDILVLRNDWPLHGDYALLEIGRAMVVEKFREDQVWPYKNADIVGTITGYRRDF